MDVVIVPKFWPFPIYLYLLQIYRQKEWDELRLRSVKNKLVYLLFKSYIQKLMGRYVEVIF